MLPPDTNVKRVHSALQARSMVCDERKPNVLRLAAVPLYNSFVDVFRAVRLLEEAIRLDREGLLSQ